MLFENPIFGPKLLKLFPDMNPFPKISDCTFRTRADIRDSVKPIMERINGAGQLDHKPWISLHVRLGVNLCPDPNLVPHLFV